MKLGAVKFLFLLFCVLSVVNFGFEPALSQTPTRQEPASVAGGTTYEYPISRFMVRNEQLYFRDATDEATLTVPIPDRIEVKSATLHLEYANSISLFAGRSQLRVSIDDAILVQYPLLPGQPNSSVDIAVPVALLKPGYHYLKFWVAQHYSSDCKEAPAAPELWTQIDTVRSKLTLKAEMRPFRQTLADLDALIDSKLWGDYALNIVTGKKGPSDAQLLWGALVAQGAALRLKYKPLQVSYVTASRRESAAADNGARNFPLLDQDPLKGRDSILIGTSGELGDYLSKELLSKIKSGFVGIYPLDEDPEHFLVIISGPTEEDVTRAATAFSFINFPFPDMQFMEVTKYDIPAFPDYGTERVVRENATYPFPYFGIRTTTLRGLNPGRINLQLRIPPDLFSRETSLVELSLHFAHGAAMRNDSVLNIYLNDRFENVIHFRDENGAVFSNYKISIPLRSFHAGLNTISFAPTLVPVISGGCEIAREESLLQFTLFEDSSLSVPNASHYVRMPDLKLFAESTFPFAVQPDGSDTALQVLANDPKTVAAAWMVMAKLAQVASVPLYKAEISFARSQGNKNLIMVGPANTFDSNIMNAAPLVLGPAGKVPYTTSIELHPDGHEMSWAQRTYKSLTDRFQTEASVPEPQIVRISQSGGMGEQSMLMEFRSPLHADKTVLAVTADNPDRLFSGVESLVQPEFWGQLQGDLVVWQRQPESLRWQKAGSDYFFGSLGTGSLLEYHFSRNPFLWTAILIALMILLALVTRYLLKLYRSRHHAHVSENAETP